MKSANKALLILMVVASLGVWGCAQGGSPASGSARLRDLEARHAKLEEDYRATVTARDAARQKATALEQERAALARQVARLQSVVKERDDLQQQLAARTGERDTLHSQLVQFGKDLQALVGRIDAAAGNAPSPPLTSAAAVEDPDKS
jgi:outer membrane murein-binding lipoprotein Lpp